MLSMQYNFILPADYDMSVIRRRIETRGVSTDDFPGLVFKAYLYASRDSGKRCCPENVYAPFYLWQHNEAMNAFLSGPIFAGVSQAFGWPAVSTWSVWHSVLTPGLSEAGWATREIVPIEPHTALAALQLEAGEALDSEMARDGALAGVTAFEPTRWTLLRFRLWREWRDEFERAGVRAYQVGHMSVPRR